jgi:hypothetical protein
LLQILSHVLDLQPPSHDRGLLWPKGLIDDDEAGASDCLIASSNGVPQVIGAQVGESCARCVDLHLGSLSARECEARPNGLKLRALFTGFLFPPRRALDAATGFLDPVGELGDLIAIKNVRSGEVPAACIKEIGCSTCSGASRPWRIDSIELRAKGLCAAVVRIDST